MRGLNLVKIATKNKKLRPQFFDLYQKNTLSVLVLPVVPNGVKCPASCNSWIQHVVRVLFQVKYNFPYFTHIIQTIVDCINCQDEKDQTFEEFGQHDAAFFPA